ncbi:zinc finger, CCHC-type containing protein [Tanacetum coccineum]|uniref:Zinc finger, CCHC-type containing protein n=1 Tax=Tanacetum coccineum TaxID=301880 RepID=A0ABQ5GH23_9ASTR
MLGSVAGSHPYPMMVHEFHAVIGKETRKQALEKWDGKPDVLVACVGGGLNVMGLFHEFVDDKEVRIDQEEVFVVWFFWKEQEGSILFGLPGSRQQKFLVLRFFDVKEQQGIDRLNIEKLDGNIVQKHGGSKQVGFKQLGPGVETGVHGVHDEKRVWFEVELQGAQGDREAEVFQVSNDDTAVAQRWLEDKQPEEKTNTDCLVKEQEKEYQTGWKIKTGNVLDSCNQRSTQQCMKSGVAKHLGVAGIQQQNGLVNKTNVTLFAKRLKTPIDMLGFFGWLASIKQGMLEPVKVKCIFLGYRKRNMGFNESGEYKKTFIGSGVGTGSMQVLQGDEFEVEPQDGHTFEGATLCMGTIQYREDSNETAFAVAAVGKIYAHESLTFNNTVACEVISKWKAGLKDDMDARSDVYVLSNGCKKCSDDSDVYYWEYTPEKNAKWSCIYAVGSQEYQIVCTRLDIASADVESGYELSLVAGIATGALVKGGSRSELHFSVAVKSRDVIWVEKLQRLRIHLQVQHQIGQEIYLVWRSSGIRVKRMVSGHVYMRLECSDGKGRRYEKGGIVAIVEGEAHGALGLRGGLLGVQTQSHIGKIIISKLTYKLGGLLLLSPIGFRMEPQLGLYVRLGEMLGLGYPTIGIRARLGPVVVWMVFPRLDPGRRYEKGGIVAIVEGEAHGGLGLRGGLLGVQTQSHIGKIIISKLTYKLGGLLLLSPIGFRMEPQLGLYAILGEMLGLGYPTIGIRARLGPVVVWMVFPRLDPGSTVLVDPGKPCTERKPVKGGVFRW